MAQKSVTLIYRKLNAAGVELPESKVLTGTSPSSKVGYNLTDVVGYVSIYADQQTFMVPAERMESILLSLG